MIQFVTGKPGDGKSMYGMHLIVQTLLNTDKVVATNIPVKLPELRSLLILKGWKPKKWNDIQERVIVLENEDVFEFYRIRSGGYVMPPSPDWIRARNPEDEDGNKIKKMARYDFLRHMTAQFKELKKNARALRPIEYHIDEAHDFFSAREWTESGRDLLWYASKHRHLHDEIYLYTQVMKNVESQLRSLANFTHRARNQLRLSWGLFRKAPIFRVYHYHGGPEDVDKVTPFDQSKMTLDLDGLCKTYNTTGAVGVHVKPEEVKNKAPLPYWALPVALCLAVLCVVAALVCVPLYGGRLAGKFMTSKIGETGASVLGAPKSQFVSAAATLPDPPRGSVAALFPNVEVEEPEHVQGVIVAGSEVLVRSRGQWNRMVRDVGQGLIELQNGTVVRASEIANPKKTPQAQRVTQSLETRSGR